MSPRGSQALIALVAGAVIALAGCASAADPPGTAGAAPQPSYLCGGVRVSSEALAARTPPDALSGTTREALADAVFDDGTPLELDDSTAWFVVDESDREVTLLREVAPDAAASAAVEADHEQVGVSWVEAANIEPGWRVTSLGPCLLTIDLSDLAVPLVALDPARPLDAAAREVHLLVTEQACNSGRDADGRVEIVRLDEGEDRIELVLGIRPEEGGHDCPSNPPTPFTVTLEAPLGDRVVVDATRYSRPELGAAGSGE